MIWGLRTFPRMPYFVEAGLLYFFTGIVFLLAHEPRNAIARNLKVVWDDASFAERYVGAFRVFVNFGWTYIDGLRMRLGQEGVTWEIEGMEYFEEIRDREGSAVILTTHTGNYDLAAALFSPKFGRDLHTVRAPEKSPIMQEIKRKEFEEDGEKYSHFKVHYNESDSLLGIELARLLSEGELVAVQADRVIGEVVGLDVPLEGKEVLMRIPKGPLTLAVISRCPCFPLHVVRDGYRHYRIIFQAALEVEGRRPREMAFAKVWAASLMGFLDEHALQWFVFEEAFTR